MWNKIKRIFQGFLDMFVVRLESAQDPEAVLRANISEMRASLAKLNHAVVLAKASVFRFQSRNTELKADEKRLLGSIEDLAKTGNDDALGVDLAAELIRVRANMEVNQAALKESNASLAKIKETRDSVNHAVNQEINSIDIKIAEAESAKIKGEISACLQEFSDSDLAFTNKEMLSKLETQKFINDSKFEVAVEDNINVKMYKSSQAAVMEEAGELFNSFKPTAKPAKAKKGAKLSK